MPVRGGGFIQGCNTQNVTSEDAPVIATELTADTNDAPWSGPMLRQAEAAAAFITARRPAAGDQPARSGPGQAPGPGPGGGTASASLIGLFLPDAGYLSEHNLTIEGPDRLIATGKTRDLEKAARDGACAKDSGHSPAIAAMAARLATGDGIAAYRQRGHIAQTPHGQIKHNMRFRQLSVRGKPKAAAEWTFTRAVHNLFKAITTGCSRPSPPATSPPPPWPASPAGPARRPARPDRPGGQQATTITVTTSARQEHATSTPDTYLPPTSGTPAIPQQPVCVGQSTTIMEGAAGSRSGGGQPGAPQGEAAGLGQRGGCVSAGPGLGGASRYGSWGSLSR